MSDPHARPNDPAPLDPFDPRFDTAAAPSHQRTLVRGRGPLPDPDDPRVRILRVALPTLFFAAIVVVGLVFYSGLRAGPQTLVLGRESTVRSAVAERPKRACFNGNNPCAWITTVGDRLVAFNTNGPLPQEYGRAGVGWCPSSHWFGANATGSRFDQHGHVARGPAPRGLDRFGLRIDRAGMVHVDFAELITGTLAAHADDLQEPAGPHCTTIPFDREADLALTGR